MAARAGSRVGKQKTCWTKALPRTQLSALNAMGRLERARGRPPEPRNGASGQAWRGLPGRNLTEILVSMAAWARSAPPN